MAFQWTTEQDQAFNALKEALTQDPVIAIYEPNKPVILHTDASGIGIGAVLMQPDDNGHKRVVAYYSRRLNCHEEKYSTSEQEVLAVVEAMEHFHVYVHGKKTTIYTDHKALQWLFSIKQPKSRLFKWSVRLSIYDYTIHHKAGKLNQVPDALSRSPITLFVDIETIKQEQAKDDISSIRKLQTRDGLLINSFRGLRRIYVPRTLRPRILAHFHDNYSHPGIVKTSQLILSNYWWDNAQEDITHYVKSCKTCQMVKTSSRPAFGKQHPPPTPDQPMHTWAIDTIVMGSAAHGTKAKYIQLIIDHHSRYVWAFGTAKNTTPTIINLLSQLFSTVGHPRTLITDNFKSFTAKQFRSFLSGFSVKHILCSPYHPQSNGICEKANDTIVRKLRLAMFDYKKLKWVTLLPQVVHNYNSTPHSATGYCPRFLHFGTLSADSPERVDLREARTQAIERSDRFKAHRKQLHDNKHSASDLKDGDLVVRVLPHHHPTKTKTTGANTGPYVIRQKIGPETYRISPEDDGDTIFTSHASDLIRFLSRPESHDVGGMKCSDDSPLHFQELPDKQGNKTPILEPCVAQQSPDSAHPSPAQVTDPASGHHM